MKIKAIIIAFLSLLCYMLLACNSTPQATKSPNPSNLETVESVLTEKIVEDDDEYTVLTEDEKYETNEDPLNLSLPNEDNDAIDAVEDDPNITNDPVFLWSDEEIPLIDGIPVFTAAYMRAQNGDDARYPKVDEELLTSELLDKVLELLSDE